MARRIEQVQSQSEWEGPVFQQIEEGQPSWWEIQELDPKNRAADDPHSTAKGRVSQNMRTPEDAR